MSFKPRRPFVDSEARRYLRHRRKDEPEGQPIRCPRCGWQMVAVVGRRGPYFQCRCPEPICRRAPN